MQFPTFSGSEKQAPSSSVEGPESNLSSNSLDKDVALAIAGEHAQPIDPVVEARVLRKIDLFLIPAMTIGTLLTNFPAESL
jgi:hypothetical protein